MELQEVSGKTNRSHDKLERKRCNNERARQHDRNTAREMKDNVQEGAESERQKENRVLGVMDEVEKQKKGREVHTFTIYLSMRHCCAAGIKCC